MSKFTKQYTTKEQSERLLKLGIPAWTADCYYDQYGIDESPSSYKYPQWLYGSDTIEVLTNRFKHKLVPCWSTGRLIEIFNACECYEDIVDLAAVPEEIIKEIDDAILNEMFDLDKLEEYK